jgi:hypothetical protein
MATDDILWTYYARGQILAWDIEKATGVQSYSVSVDTNKNWNLIAAGNL